jgi:uncharacterized C2H2 Zn-finger protein
MEKYRECPKCGRIYWAGPDAKCNECDITLVGLTECPRCYALFTAEEYREHAVGCAETHRAAFQGEAD